MTTFRIHYADGSKLTVQASNPADARKQAEAKRGGLISKVKKLKEAA
jgi:hypothetical protein